MIWIINGVKENIPRLLLDQDYTKEKLLRLVNSEEFSKFMLPN